MDPGVSPSSAPGTDSLLAARRSLRATLYKSRAIAAALDGAAPRIHGIHRRLPSLLSALRPLRVRSDALSAVSSHIDRAVGPAAAVLKVFDAVHGLEVSLLSDPSLDLDSYLAVFRRLEEAVHFLSDNCALAVSWLDDAVAFVEENAIADSCFVAELRASLRSLREHPKALDGGLLAASLDRLQAEFCRLLADGCVPLRMSPIPSPDAGIQTPDTPSPSPIPFSVLQKLVAILERLMANGRLETCIQIYADVRAANVRASMGSLDLHYLEISPEEFDDVQSIEQHIEQWAKHLEFAVKHLLHAEHGLCCEVFERSEKPDVPARCFAQIATQSGIFSLLKFGRTVTESKKDPIKLLKLLDVFSTLDKLRLDFNRIFGSKPCSEIQIATRDLIKRVVDGACDIFSELLMQVELQREMVPPPDGSVPKLVTFITDYCNRLLGEEYRPVLAQILVIHQTWKKEVYQEDLLAESILDIVRALEQNFEAWSKSFEDVKLSYLFMMNSHWHFYKKLQRTKLAEIMGDAWLREHSQYKEYYAAVFLRETWGKLPGLLSRDGLILLSGGTATARDLVKRRLKAFNGAFDEMHRKQLTWVVPDKGLREKLCHLIVQAIVPAYRSYMQNYGPLVEQSASASKYVKYTACSLENMLVSLFQQKSRSTSLKGIYTKGKINNVSGAA